MADTYRGVVTSILLSNGHSSWPKALMFTSAGPGEGKSTTVSNLAIALAQIGKKVLIIDADLRNPRQHWIFDLRNDGGLSTLLAHRSLRDAELDDFVQKTTVPNLSILPSGAPGAATANLLYSGNLADLVMQFQKEFDIILIDTPPLLGSPDARLLGRLVDGAVLVIRAGHTSLDEVRALKRRLIDDQTPILGTVLNDWQPMRGTEYESVCA
jgi:polysaccharide biosynthesis transport protein